MQTKVYVRTIKPEDRQAVADLHEKHYWRSHCLLLNQKFYCWQFVENPYSVEAGGDQSVVAIGQNGELLSFLGLVPMPASFCGRPIQAAHLISWLSSPESRGRGVGKKLMSHVSERYDFLFGRSVTPAALAIYQSLGFRYFGRCGRWIAVVNPDETISLAVNPSEIGKKRIRARAIKSTKSVSYYVCKEVPPGAAGLFSTIFNSCVAFDRTNDYLSWRYEKHPYLDYRFLVVGDPLSPDSFAVLRTENVSGRSGRILRILEFIAGSDASIRLAEAIFAYASDQGCAFMDVFGISEQFVVGFVAMGGFNWEEEPAISLPHLFQPWDEDPQPPGVLFFGRPNFLTGKHIGPVDDITKIYVSKGDGNMDWPSWIPIGGKESIAPPTRLY